MTEKTVMPELAEDIPVTGRKHIQIFRETITPPAPGAVLGILDKLLKAAKTQQIDGSIVVNFSQGGVRNITIEDTEEEDSD